MFISEEHKTQFPLLQSQCTGNNVNLFWHPILDENRSYEGVFPLSEEHMFWLPLKTTDDQLMTQNTGSIG